MKKILNNKFDNPMKNFDEGNCYCCGKIVYHREGYIIRGEDRGIICSDCFPKEKKFYKKYMQDLTSLSSIKKGKIRRNRSTSKQEGWFNKEISGDIKVIYNALETQRRKH